MKKIICILLMGLLVLAGCTSKAPNEIQEQQNEKIESDQIITTYAYANNDEIDVSSLKVIELDLESEMNKIVGDEQYNPITLNFDFFGEVKDVCIYAAPFYSDVESTDLIKYDTLKDTRLVIKTLDVAYSDAIFAIDFSDMNGNEKFFTSWDNYNDGQPTRLISGFTKEEKTPTTYEELDITQYIELIGMPVEEFRTTQMAKGIDTPYEYTLSYPVEIQPGIIAEFMAECEWIDMGDFVIPEDSKIESVLFSTSFSESEVPKVSICNVDFDMTAQRARYQFEHNYKNTYDNYDVSISTYRDSEDDEGHLCDINVTN